MRNGNYSSFFIKITSLFPSSLITKSSRRSSPPRINNFSSSFIEAGVLRVIPKSFFVFLNSTSTKVILLQNRTNRENHCRISLLLPKGLKTISCLHVDCSYRILTIKYIKIELLRNLRCLFIHSSPRDLFFWAVLWGYLILLPWVLPKDNNFERRRSPLRKVIYINILIICTKNGDSSLFELLFRSSFTFWRFILLMI